MNILNIIHLINRIHFFFRRYDDLLELPLQPLSDNLDCYTYEIFERDPVKYILYQRAIEQALMDRIEEKDIESTTVSDKICAIPNFSYNKSIVCHCYFMYFDRLL